MSSSRSIVAKSSTRPELRPSVERDKGTVDRLDEAPQFDRNETLAIYSLVHTCILHYESQGMQPQSMQLQIRDKLRRWLDSCNEQSGLTQS